MSNANDSCAYCGRVRANLWHRVTSDPGTHAFVEPAPRPSADEAKVREILDRTGWFFEVPRDKAQLVGHDEVLGLLHEAYAAGKADGARVEREALAGIAKDRMSRCGHRAGTCRSCMEDGALIDLIARRGSEGK